MFIATTVKILSFCTVIISIKALAFVMKVSYPFLEQAVEFNNCIQMIMLLQNIIKLAGT
jgi:hypothetical protein